MASKKYAYYNKGNKIALVEQSNSTSSGKLAVAHCTIGGHSTKDTCEAAGGQWIPGSSGSLESVGEYLSPVESVDEGLEIEYTYSPTYTLNTDSTVQVNKFYINGWTTLNGYLTFIRNHNSGVANWTAAPYSVVADDEYIQVNNSARWNGLHKVKTAYANGLLKTYTKVNVELPSIRASSGGELSFRNETADGEASITGDDDEGHHLNSVFNTGEYIFIASVHADWDGMWQINRLDPAGSTEEDQSGIWVKNKYYIHRGTGGKKSTEGIKYTISGTNTPTTSDVTATADDTDAIIYKCYRDFCYIQADITAMENEDFDLDLTRYQSNAVVYYLRAKIFEDAGDIEKYEYYMRQFKKQLEKGSGSRKYGPHIVQGHWNMKK